MGGKYKIICNGRFTRVFDPNGNEMQNVRALTFRAGGADYPTATLELIDIEVEIEGDCEVVCEMVNSHDLAPVGNRVTAAMKTAEGRQAIVNAIRKERAFGSL